MLFKGLVPRDPLAVKPSGRISFDAPAGQVNVQVLADPANAYNLVPDAVRPGDVLIERWQRVGIGHTLVVKDVVVLGEGNLDAALVSGSMPRRQGKWESGVVSKSYFTNENTGGEGG